MIDGEGTSHSTVEDSLLSEDKESSLLTVDDSLFSDDEGASHSKIEDSLLSDDDELEVNVLHILIFTMINVELFV